jgi:hypothetical protein
MQIRRGFLALAIISPASFFVPPAVAQGSCPAELATTDQRLRATLQRLETVRSAPLPRRCAVFRQHVAVMREASATFRRCTTGRHRDENVGQMEGSIADWQEIISRNCR